MLTREDILNSQDLTIQVVSVPEWGGDVIVKTMSGVERDAFEASIVQGGVTDTRNIRAKLAAMSVVDSSRNLMFTQADIVELGNKSAAALDRIFTVASKLSGISQSDIDELEKNS